MKTPFSRIPAGWLWTAGLIVVAIAAFLTRNLWWSSSQEWVRSAIAGSRQAPLLDEHDHGAAGHTKEAGHEHAGHDAANSLELSEQAMRNIGLSAEFLQPLKLETFRRSITVPGIVAERPGRTLVQVSTPMAGVVTHVHAVQGEAILPGTLLFQLRITAEALVSTQTELLKTIGELDVENREIARLTKVTESGAVAPKLLLDRQYAKEKLESLVNAQREALRLQGLSDRQILDIEINRRLLRELQILAPSPDDHEAEELRLTGQASLLPIHGSVEPVNSVVPTAAETGLPSTGGLDNEIQSPLILQEVRVHKGQTVPAGDTLCVLADYADLYIQGQAFEQDVELLLAAAQRGWKVSAIFKLAGGKSQTIPDLQLVYSSSGIHADSRTLPFYVGLPNTIVRDVASPNGQRFIDWQFRPGRRMQVQVPVEEWTDQFVVPVEAIAREGAESFVFQQNGPHFDRVPVHVSYRDATQAVIANDGSIFPDDVIALRGAHQLQMALKNKSGGGADPHAGHNH